MKRRSFLGALAAAFPLAKIVSSAKADEAVAGEFIENGTTISVPKEATWASSPSGFEDYGEGIDVEYEVVRSITGKTFHVRVK
jgi:hypothetical protein